MLCFRVFQLSYFADVDLLLPIPIWVPTPDHWQDWLYDFKPSLSGWNSWLLAGLVDESWRHWTVTSWYYVNVVVTAPECCDLTGGRSVSWYDSETHPQLVSPDLDYQTLVCIIANASH